MSQGILRTLTTKWDGSDHGGPAPGDRGMTVKRTTLAIVALATALAVLAPTNAAPVLAADEVSAPTHLNPWSIDGALFARGADGVAGVDIPGTCHAAYLDWYQERLAEHSAMTDDLVAEYWRRVAANEAAILVGETPPYPTLPPTGTTTEAQFVALFMAVSGVPADFQQWIEMIWEPMEYAPGTGVPCFGVGVLPSPPGGFIGIRPGDEPAEPDPCVGKGHLPFSPAVWTWYPEWHEDAPKTEGGSAYSGIESRYSADGATFIFQWIPIIFGVQLQIECLAIFPGGEASDHFYERLPAAQLTIVPDQVGATGVDTKLWYDFADPDNALVGPLQVELSWRGTEWRLSAYAWVDAVGWDLDSSGGVPMWDESIDFPDTEWVPATPAEYAALGGSLDEPARIYVYEAKDLYTIATGVTWRGYYVVEEISGIGWGFTELYDPVTRWTILPYQVDEIVGRRN